MEVFIVSILVVSAVHELAHFEVARRAGIKATKIGFGLKIPGMSWLSVSIKIKDVEVSLNPILIMAYVILDPKEIEKLNSTSKKIAIFAAGSLANLFSGMIFLTIAKIMKGSGFFESFISSLIIILETSISFPGMLLNFSNLKENVAGPIGIMNFISNFSVSGDFSLVLLLASFSVGVGLFNLIPILPLDGGHIFDAIYEKLLGKDTAICKKVRKAFVYSSAAIFVALIGFIVLNDLGVFK